MNAIAPHFIALNLGSAELVIIGLIFALVAVPIGLFVWFVMRRSRSQAEGSEGGVDGVRKKCPDCAEAVHVEARVCKHCGFRFDGHTQKA